MPKKPSKEDLLSWANDAWRRNNKQYVLDLELDDVYFSRHQVILPVKNVVQIERKTSLAADTINRLKAMVMSKPPLPNVRIGTMNIEDKRNAEEAETWLNAQWAVQRQGDDVWAKIVEDMLRLGRGVSITEYVPAAWGNFPIREKGQSDDDYLLAVTEFNENAGSPISWRHVPAVEFVPVRDGKDITAGFWFGTREAMQVQRKYGRKVPKLTERLNSRDITPMDKVPFVTYADAYHTAYMVGDVLAPLSEDITDRQVALTDLVSVFEHPLGMVPFVLMPGLQTSSTNPILQYLSALYFLAPLIRDLDNVRSARATLLHNYVYFGPLVQYLNSSGTPVGDDREAAKLKWEPGGTLVAWKDLGEDFKFLEHPGVHASVDSEIELLLNEINRLGTAPMEMADPAMSGVARNIALQIAASKFGTYTGSMALGVNQIMQRWMAVAKHIIDRPDAPDNIGLYVDSFSSKYGHLKLEKRHFKRPLRVEVSIPSPIKPDILAMMDYVTAARQGEWPFLPDEVLYEDMVGYTDPQRIKDLLIQQRWERSPKVAAAQEDEVVRRLGMALDAEDLAQAVALPSVAPEEIPPALLEAMNTPPPPPPPPPMAGPLITGRPEGQVQNQANIARQVGTP